MNLKHKPTAFMPVETMYAVERSWGMSKAAWMDVAWDLMQERLGTENAEEIAPELKRRCDLICSYRTNRLYR